MKIHEVTNNDADDWLRLARQLWPDYKVDELQMILDSIRQSTQQAGFLVRDDEGVAIGFLNLSLRTDYVPGATQSPVGYLEGIYVKPTHRHQGVGRAMIEQAERWTRQQGCSELASDVLLGNELSEAFHHRMGFDEVDRVITFIKPLSL